jgi:hypothetical protein
MSKVSNRKQKFFRGSRGAAFQKCPPGRRKVNAGILFFIIFIIYLSFLPVNYDFDGTVFSHYLRYAVIKNDLVLSAQPQHPLYIPINYLLYKTLHTLTGYNPLEYFHLQLFSLLFGLLALWVSYKLIAKMTEHSFIPLIGTALTAFSFAVWYYSVEAEVHMPGVFFIAAGMFLLFFKPADSDKWHHLLWPALCFAMAAAFHLANGLIAFSVLLIFLIERVPFKKIVRFFSFYAVSVISVLALLALTSKQNLLAHYKSQVLGSDTLAGHKISYWTGFSFQSLWESVKSAAYGILPVSPPALSFAALLIFAAAIAVIITGAIKHWKSRIPGGRNPYIRLTAWMLPYFVFFTFWDHRNTEFKLNVILPFLILFTVSLASLTRKREKTGLFILIVLTLSVFSLNYYFALRPVNDIHNNESYMIAEAIGEKTPPGSIIVIGGCGPEISIHNTVYIPYFALRETFKLDWMLGKGHSLENICDRIKQERSKGTPVYLFSEIDRDRSDGKTLRQLFKNHHLTAADYFHFLDRLQPGEKIPLIGPYYLKQL